MMKFFKVVSQFNNPKFQVNIFILLEIKSHTKTFLLIDQLFDFESLCPKFYFPKV